jgi:glutamate synthase (NADPH/NADH) small chain
MEKWRLDRRLDQIRAEGAVFECGVAAGTDITAAELRRDYQVIVLACGARVPRTLRVAGADLDGIHQAMEYLPLANRAATAQAGAEVRGEGAVVEPAISARGRHVVIIGGGDTGADCLGTALRQGAASVTQLEIMPRPPEHRPAGEPWPTHPMIFRVSTAHEEGGERVYAVSTQAFLANAAGRVRALRLADVDLANGSFSVRPGTERELTCELVLLAMGFAGAEDGDLLAGLGIELTGRGTVPRDNGYAASEPGVFVAGDMGRGQSLIVWAIAEGRSAAAAADRYLSGTTALPVAIPASAAPLRLAGR